MGSILLLPFLGSINLFDWDEANFAELAREMIYSKNYLQPQINYLPFYEKPPVFIWMQVLSMKVFGITEFAARFPNAILGIIVMLTLYWIGRRERGSKFGFLWMLTYIGSLLPFMYFRTGLIDPWFNYFMFLALYFYYSAAKLAKNSLSYLILSAFMLGIAVQTKGPVALIIVFGTLGFVWLISRFKFYLGLWRSIFWLFLTLFFSSLWFIYETRVHGATYLNEFVNYQIRLFTTEDALHGGPFYYHFLALLIGCFPASFYMFDSKIYKENWQDDWTKTMFVCGLLVLILFSVVQTKIIHYSSMAYYPITYFAALSLYDESKKGRSFLNFITICFLVILSVCIVAIPILGVNLHSVLTSIQDLQTRSQLALNVEWSYYECVWGIGVLILAIVLWVRLKDRNWIAFILTPTIVLIIMIVFTPKLERYIQGTLIDFYKSNYNKNVDIQTLYIKSYANLFYANKKPFLNDSSKTHLFYLYDTISRPVYFVLRQKEDHYIDTNVLVDLTKIKDENGFCIYSRLPN